MSCEDIPSLLDLQKVKKHADDFGRLMGTGEGDSTNEVTGQVRPTYNKVIGGMNNEFDTMIGGMNNEFDTMIGGMNNEFDTMIGGMNNEFDTMILNMGFTRIGTFAAGATLTNPRQTLLWDIADGGDGQEYGWSGVFPPSGKVVSPGSTPLTTGGIAVGAWISRFDPELRIQVREALRRSYAEAGYNLVDGSFEAGGTLVNANDVLLQERTGKAFSGPAGTVAAGTNPASGGFVDKSGVATSASAISNANGGSVQDFIDDYDGFTNALLAEAGIVADGQPDTVGDSKRVDALVTLFDRKFPTVAAMKAASGLKVGQKCSTGATTWRVVSGSRGIDLFGGLKAISLNGLYIDDFGCVADGALISRDAAGVAVYSGTDNSTAFKSAIDAFLSEAGKKLIANSGQYNFSDNAVLSYIGSKSAINGYSLKGQGGASANTVFALVTGGVAKWFYQNTAGTKHYYFMKIEGIKFESDDIQKGNFFNANSNGHEQGFSFWDVRVSFMNVVNKVDGNVGNSEWKWFGCKFNHIYNTLLLLNNPQAVNHEYHNCDAEVMLGDIVQYGAGGGGSVKFFGGSIILSNHSLPAKEGAIVHVTNASGAGVGTGNQDISLLGIKTELKDPLKRLFRAANTAQSVVTCIFRDSNLTTVSTTDVREAVTVRAGQIVRFDNCELPKKFTYKVVGTNLAQSFNGLITFDNCKDDKDLNERCSVDNFYGSISARNMTYVDTAGGDIENVASDFDINPANNGRSSRMGLLKTASLLQTRNGWPFNGTSEQSLLLPQNSVITSIKVYRPPSGNSANLYELIVGNNDKTVIYGQSTQQFQKNDHSFTVENLNLNVGTDLNKRVVRLWSLGGNVYIGNPGFVIVEYF